MQTTVYAVRAELVSRFTTYLAGLPKPPPVFYTDPDENALERFVCVGSAPNGVRRTVKRMPHDITSSTDEEYELTIVLWSLVRGRHTAAASQQAAEEVASWFEALSIGLRTSQDAWTLGGLVTTATFGDYTPEDYSLHEGRASRIDATVSITAARI